MNKVIIVPRREALLTRDQFEDLAASLRRVPVSRREMMEWGTWHLYDWTEFGGKILTAEGEPITVYPGILDDVHGEASDGEWISEQRRRDQPRRRPRKSLLNRLRVWNAVFAIAGVPVGSAERWREVAEVRELLNSFTPVWRARYVHEVRKLRRTFAGSKAVHYGATIKQLRIRFAEELAAWNAA